MMTKTVSEKEENQEVDGKNSLTINFDFTGMLNQACNYYVIFSDYVRSGLAKRLSGATFSCKKRIMLNFVVAFSLDPLQ